MEQFLDHLRQHRAYQYGIRGLFLLISLVLAFQLVKLGQASGEKLPGSTDLIAYWGAGQLFRSGENPYDFDKLHALQLKEGFHNELPVSMWNPPWLLVWLFPLLLLPFPTAAVVWLFTSGTLILISATLLWRSLAQPSDRRLIGIAWVASIAFAPTLFTLGLGQVSSLLILGLAGFLYFQTQGRDFLAGMCLSLTTIKFHVVYLPWIALGWWVLTERRWQTLAGIAAVMLSSIGFLAIFCPASFAGYRAVVEHPPLRYVTPTVGGLLRLLTSDRAPWLQFLVPLMVGLSLFAYFCIRRPRIEWKSDLGPLLLLSIPTAAYGWSFDQVVLLVPYMQILVWVVGDQIGSNKQKATILLGLVFISSAMVAQNMLGQTDEFLAWAPWGFVVVYVYALVNRHRTPNVQAGAQAVSAGC